MSNPDFTVVIPVHNGASYIEAALRSIFAQTYPQYSIIVLENASTDRTVELVNSFNSPRITLLPSTSLLSIEANWSRIIDAPLSEYFTFIGHDDLLYPEFLAEMAALIAAEPEASLYQAHFEEIDANGQPVRRQRPVSYRESADEFLSAVMDEREEVCGTGYVIRTADYRRVGGIPAFPGLLYADVVLWYRLAALSCKVCTPRTLAGYRVHPQSTHQHTRFTRYYQALRDYHAFLTSHLTPGSADAYAHNMLQRIYRNAAAQMARRASGAPCADFDAALQTIHADGVFELTDIPGRLYHAAAGLPYLLRRLVLLPLDIRRALRQRRAS